MFTRHPLVRDGNGSGVRGEGGQQHVEHVRDRRTKAPQFTSSTILFKSPWDTRRKSLTQLPVVSYCYQIIVLSTHSLTPSPLSPQINVELNMYEVFSPTATLSRGEGGWTTFLQGTWNLIIKLDSVPTILSRIVDPRRIHGNQIPKLSPHAAMTEYLKQVKVTTSLNMSRFQNCPLWLLLQVQSYSLDRSLQTAHSSVSFWRLFIFWWNLHLCYPAPWPMVSGNINSVFPYCFNTFFL